MSTSRFRYYLQLDGDDYQQRFLVALGERFDSYGEEERVEHILLLAEDHLDFLSDGRADRRPVFVDRTLDEPPANAHPLEVDEVTFWPLPRY